MLIVALLDKKPDPSTTISSLPFNPDNISVEPFWLAPKETTTSDTLVLLGFIWYTT